MTRRYVSRSFKRSPPGSLPTDPRPPIRPLPSPQPSPCARNGPRIEALRRAGRGPEPRPNGRMSECLSLRVRFLQPDVDARGVPVVGLVEDVHAAVAVQVGDAGFVKADALREFG